MKMSLADTSSASDASSVAVAPCLTPSTLPPVVMLFTPSSALPVNFDREKEAIEEELGVGERRSGGLENEHKARGLSE